MILSDWYEQEYPKHARTSCSDEHPINAEVNGHGCWRCNAILFTHYDELVEEVKQLRKQLLDGQAQQDAACVAPVSDKPACGSQNAEPAPQLRDWEISCEECGGAGYVLIKRQVAERDTDVITSREPCEACDERGYVIAHGDVPGIEEYVDGRQHNHLPDAAKMVGQARDARDAREYLTTHATSIRSAFEDLECNAEINRDEGIDDKSYYRHEIAALDAALAALQQGRQP